MKFNIKLIVSLTIYSLGLISILISDIYISTYFSLEEISHWAGLKSIIFLFGGCCLLGFEQVLVRHPNYIESLYYRLLFQLLTLSIFFSLIVSLFYQHYSFWVVFLCITLFAFNQLHYSVFRANRSLISSQISTNGWKILFVTVMFVTGVVSDSLILAFVFASFFSVINYFHRYKRNDFCNIDSNNSKKLRIEGFAFALNNFTLITAAYGEQFFINIFGDSVASSILFMHFSFITPIALSLNGFIGFYLSPYLKKRQIVTKHYYNKLGGVFAVYSLFVSLISFFFGYFLFSYLKPDAIFYYEVAIPIVITCVIRSGYILSSSVLGVFSSKEILLKLARLNWFVLFLYITFLVIVLINFNGKSAAILIALLSLIHWCLRFVLSHYFARKGLGFND
ncbi:hypothetical protein BA894_01645 [Vibrio natriegens]|uniref:hypothetical protein n=1 Tax=Vibrio natriegens TaxID=691 RepID=UPI000804043B|nr:hypothetical protein [Vibrio natriegens]ANQ25233.1 hypothetical protein BA894_01645 [Vibrio natriegens]